MGKKKRRRQERGKNGKRRKQHEQDKTRGEVSRLISLTLADTSGADIIPTRAPAERLYGYTEPVRNTLVLGDGDFSLSETMSRILAKTYAEAKKARAPPPPSSSSSSSRVVLGAANPEDEEKKAVMASLVATAYDSRSAVNSKYKSASPKIAALEKRGANVQFKVDATRIGEVTRRKSAIVPLQAKAKKEKKGKKGKGRGKGKEEVVDEEEEARLRMKAKRAKWKMRRPLWKSTYAAASKGRRHIAPPVGGWDMIVFFFPHSGRQRVHVNRALLAAFFQSALHCLAPKGVIHLALKTQLPYSQWNAVQIAHDAGFSLVAAHPLVSTGLIDLGYSHKTTLEDAERFNPKHSLIYVFAHDPNSSPPDTLHRATLPPSESDSGDDHHKSRHKNKDHNRDRDHHNDDADSSSSSSSSSSSFDDDAPLFPTSLMPTHTRSSHRRPRKRQKKK